MARINSYTKITGSPADSDCFIIDSTQGTAGTRIVLWSVLKNVLNGIFAPKNHQHSGNDITSAVANANKATSDSLDQNIASTYVKELTVNGRTITVKRGNNSTYAFQTQDTTYRDADDNNAGLLSARNHQIITWMYKYYLELADIVDHNGVPSLHFTNGSGAANKRDVYLDAADINRSGIMSRDDWRFLHTLKTLDQSQYVPANADLNDYRAIGWYTIIWGPSSTLKNMPVSGSTIATLIVLKNAGNEVDQVLINALDAHSRSGRRCLFMRHYGAGGGNTWDPWQDITAYSSATQSADGLMTAADKRKLDGLSSDVAGSIPLATPSRDGLMPKGDKAKLDAIRSISDATIDGFFNH